MSEVSNLKLKLNTMDKDRLDFDRFRDSEVCELILHSGILFVSAFFLSLSSHLNTHTHTHISHESGWTPGRIAVASATVKRDPNK